MPKKEYTVKMRAKSHITTAVGAFQLFLYSGGRDNREHLVFMRGEAEGKKNARLFS